MNHIDIQPHHGWFDSTIEDFCDLVCPHFGLSVGYKEVAFSGFWSQGDGASFKGNFYLSDVVPSDLKAAYPTAVELHNLVEELAELAKEHPEIQGKVSRMSSLYSHANTMVIGDWSSNDGYHNEDTEAFLAADAETPLLCIFRDLANWLYRRLSSEYDFCLADETARQWSEAIEERKSLQVEFVQLQVDVAENPPQSKVQAGALTAAIAAMEVEIETLTSKIDQLSGQFRYRTEDGPLTIGQFYEDYF